MVAFTTGDSFAAKIVRISSHRHTDGRHSNVHEVWKDEALMQGFAAFKKDRRERGVQCNRGRLTLKMLGARGLSHHFFMH